MDDVVAAASEYSFFVCARDFSGICKIWSIRRMLNMEERVRKKKIDYVHKCLST